MAAVNVVVNVSDPDLLIDGGSPYFHYEAVYIQLYRWSTEALARAGVAANSVASGTLVHTWDLRPTTEEYIEDDGPHRYAYYDAGQGSDSWYAYRFANSGLASFSQLSDPWQSDNRDVTTLRDILFEIGDRAGQSIVRGTATAGSATTITCTSVFQSSLRSSEWFVGQWVLISRDAAGAGAAPEGQQALIASVDTATGVATLDRTLTAAVASGDTFLVSLVEPSIIISAVNAAREDMEVLVYYDVALSRGESRYPAPQGLTKETDLSEAYIVRQYTNSNAEDQIEVPVHVRQDGPRAWLVPPDWTRSSHYSLLRIRYKRNYRSLEGVMALMSDTTEAPIEWLRAVAYLKVAERMTAEDEEEPLYQRWLQDATREVIRHKEYAPVITRSAVSGGGATVLPGPGAVI